MTHFDNHNFSSNPPGQAPSSTSSGVGIAFDYSDHLDRIVLALEQSAIASTETANQLNDINTKLDILVNNSTTIAQKQTLIANYQETIKNLAQGDGVHVIGPWEWLGYASIVKLFEDKGINLAELKAKVEAVAKQSGFPGY
jgi:hypothetical protein